MQMGPELGFMKTSDQVCLALDRGSHNIHHCRQPTAARMMTVPSCQHLLG